MSDDNASKQWEELEALTSIYGDCVQIRSTSEQQVFDIIIDDVTLTVTMPFDYPSVSPPQYELSAALLRGADKQRLCQQLELIYAEGFVGEPGVVYSWVECVRTFIEEWKTSQKVDPPAAKPDPEDELSIDFEKKISVERSSISCPEILTGECIEDRRSVFQPHFANVKSVEEVQLVVKKLLENRKIANATHNMYAYRIKTDSRGLLQDCDDDGETHAGSRMLHLLDILNVENVLVVVTRWYGGIQLGPDRFKHINGATRAILEKAGVLNSTKKEHTKGKKSKR